MDDNNNNPAPDKTGDNGDKSEPNEKTFTQDQVNDIVSKRLSEANQKADKRVKDEVAKALAEAERQSKLTESESEKEFKAKQKAELDERERNITLRERRADAKDVLADKGIDSSLVDFVIDVDEEKTNLNIEKLEKAFNAAVEKGVQAKLKGNTPEDYSTKPTEKKTFQSGPRAF